MTSAAPPDPLTRQAQSLLGSGQHGKALDLLQAACGENDSNPAHWFLLGAAQAESGRIADAEASFRRVLSFIPDHSNALANLGRTLVLQQRHAEAVEPLERALQINPAHRMARIALMDALAQLQRFDDAEAQCSVLIDLEPGNPDTLVRRGNLYLMQNRLDAAIDCFDRVLDIDPAMPFALLNKGLALQKRGDFAPAIELFQQAVKFRPDMDSAWNLLATALLAKADIKGALQAFENACKRNARNITAADHLARLYRQTGRKSESLDVYRRILEVEPGHARARFFLEAESSSAPDQGPVRIPADMAQEIYRDKDAGFRFDDSLQGALKYRAPDVLNEAVREALGDPGEGIDILELGCGSGICGSKLADIARSLVGTDLSTNMLDAARAKNTYDELYEADLVDVLSRDTAVADLVIAMDVLCFFGDLHEIFENTHRTLRESGIFGFSVVKPESENPWELNQYGHFAHSPRHLEDVARKTGFERIFIQEMVMRRELNEDRFGYVCLYRRKASP